MISSIIIEGLIYGIMVQQIVINITYQQVQQNKQEEAGKIIHQEQPSQ